MMDESKDRDAIDGAVRVAHLVKHPSSISRIVQLLSNLLKTYMYFSFLPAKSFECALHREGMI